MAQVAVSGRGIWRGGACRIGKERLYLEVARRLKRKVFVTEAKRRLLCLLGLPKETEDLLTTDDCTNLHVVGMHALRPAALSKELERHGDRFHTCVAFRPSGWCSSGTGKPKGEGVLRSASQRWQG